MIFDRENLLCFLRSADVLRRTCAMAGRKSYQVAEVSGGKAPALTQGARHSQNLRLCAALGRYG